MKGLPTLLFIIAGGVVSALDWIGVCTESCAEASLYRLFGFPLPPFGVAYFAMCAAAWFIRHRHPVLFAALAALLSGGLGAELFFTWIQWQVIGKWCMMCVAIACCVAGACAVLLLEYFLCTTTKLSAVERKFPMKRSFVHAVLVLFVLCAGFGTATLGLKKPDAIAAAVTQETLTFGPPNSSYTVYIISDWFCPACRTAEPEIIKGAREAMKQAKVLFVDYPIHRETLNYVPFNLAFMVAEKDKYLKIREALGALSLKTKEPTPEDVQAAVSPLGVRYTPLNFSDIVSGTQIQMSIVQKFKPPGTPEVVIVDSMTEKTIRLSGTKEITSEKILKALSDLSVK
jgi:hypothetical protein